jgi:IclR family pca regulon transcriptional regulator
MGRAILAVLPQDTADRLLRQHEIVAVTPVTVTDPKRIEQIVAQARIDGYCIVADESDLGGTGVATCI